jgi:hypothetical protein
VFKSLLEVGAQSAPAGDSLVRDLVVLVKTLGTLGGIELLVEVCERGSEAVRDAVLLVQSDRFLDRLVADYVSVGQVLCQDAGAGLVFLGDVVLFFLGLGGCSFGAGDVFDVVGCFDVDGGGAELGLVEEEGGLGGAVLGDLVSFYSLCS